MCGLSQLLIVAPPRPTNSPRLPVGVEAEAEPAEAEAEAESLLRRALSVEVWGLASRV